MILHDRKKINSRKRNIWWKKFCSRKKYICVRSTRDILLYACSSIFHYYNIWYINILLKKIFIYNIIKNKFNRRNEEHFVIMHYVYFNEFYIGFMKINSVFFVDLISFQPWIYYIQFW